MKTWTRALITLSLSAAVAMGTIPALANEPIGKVIAVKQSGWATRMNDSVKKTIKIGDKVYEGDILDIKHGNFVEIALGDDESNVLYLDGNTLVQLFANGKHNVELKRGSVFALLDDLSKSQNRFTIATPTAVSAVRGTYFKAQANANQSITTVYQGIVTMSGRAENGRALKNDVALNPGMKSIVGDFAQAPSEPAKVSRQEFDEINAIISKISGKRGALDYDAIMSGAGAHSEKELSDAENDLDVKAEKSKKASQDEFDSGNVVF